MIAGTIVVVTLFGSMFFSTINKVWFSVVVVLLLVFRCLNY